MKSHCSFCLFVLLATIIFILSFVAVISQAIPWQFSLYGGTDSNSGVLVAQHNNKIGSVCDDRISGSRGLETISAICRMINPAFADRGVKWHSATSGQSKIFNTVLDEVYCPLNASDFATECNFNTYHDCGKSEDLVVYCNVTRSEYEFSLVTSSSSSSSNSATNLLLASNQTTRETGISYSVCDDSFGPTTLQYFCRVIYGDNDAEKNVSLGVYYPQAMWSGIPTSKQNASAPIGLDSIVCLNENRLRSFSHACSYTTNHDCSIRESVALHCYGATKFSVRISSNNVIQIRPVLAGRYTYSDGIAFPSSQKVLNSPHFNVTVARLTAPFLTTKFSLFPVWSYAGYHNFSCPENAKSFGDCSYNLMSHRITNSYYYNRLVRSQVIGIKYGIGTFQTYLTKNNLLVVQSGNLSKNSICSWYYNSYSLKINLCKIILRDRYRYFWKENNINVTNKTLIAKMEQEIESIPKHNVIFWRNLNTLFPPRVHGEFYQTKCLSASNDFANCSTKYIDSLSCSLTSATYGTCDGGKNIFTPMIDRRNNYNFLMLRDPTSSFRVHTRWHASLTNLQKNISAVAICRLMGYANATTETVYHSFKIKYNPYVYPTLYSLFDDVYCPSINVKSFSECNFRYRDLASENIARDSRTFFGVTTLNCGVFARKWEFELVEHLLPGNENSSSGGGGGGGNDNKTRTSHNITKGLLMVRAPDRENFGSVCSGYFSKSAAIFICRLLLGKEKFDPYRITFRSASQHEKGINSTYRELHESISVQGMRSCWRNATHLSDDFASKNVEKICHIDETNYCYSKQVIYLDCLSDEKIDVEMKIDPETKILLMRNKFVNISSSSQKNATTTNNNNNSNNNEWHQVCFSSSPTMAASICQNFFGYHKNQTARSMMWNRGSVWKFYNLPRAYPPSCEYQQSDNAIDDGLNQAYCRFTSLELDPNKNIINCGGAIAGLSCKGGDDVPWTFDISASGTLTSQPLSSGNAYSVSYVGEQFTTYARIRGCRAAGYASAASTTITTTVYATTYSTYYIWLNGLNCSSPYSPLVTRIDGSQNQNNFSSSFYSLTPNVSSVNVPIVYPNLTGCQFMQGSRPIYVKKRRLIYCGSYYARNVWKFRIDNETNILEALPPQAQDRSDNSKDWGQVLFNQYTLQRSAHLICSAATASTQPYVSSYSSTPQTKELVLCYYSCPSIEKYFSRCRAVPFRSCSSYAPKSRREVVRLFCSSTTTTAAPTQTAPSMPFTFPPTTSTHAVFTLPTFPQHSTTTSSGGGSTKDPSETTTSDPNNNNNHTFSGAANKNREGKELFDSVGLPVVIGFCALILMILLFILYRSSNDKSRSEKEQEKMQQTQEQLMMSLMADTSRHDTAAAAMVDHQNNFGYNQHHDHNHNNHSNNNAVTGIYITPNPSPTANSSSTKNNNNNNNNSNTIIAPTGIIAPATHSTFQIQQFLSNDESDENNNNNNSQQKSSSHKNTRSSTHLQCVPISISDQQQETNLQPLSLSAAAAAASASSSALLAPSESVAILLSPDHEKHQREQLFEQQEENNNSSTATSKRSSTKKKKHYDENGERIERVSMPLPSLGDTKKTAKKKDSGVGLTLADL